MYCHGLNVCVFRKFVCWNSSAQCERMRKWDLWVVSRSWGRNAHQRDSHSQESHPHSSSPAHSTCWGAVRVCSHRLEEGPHYGSCWHPGLELPASRTVDDQVLLFIIHLLWDVLWSRPVGSDTTFKCTAQWLVTYENTLSSPARLRHRNMSNTSSASFPSLYSHPRVNSSSDSSHFMLIFPVLELHMNEILQYLLCC